MVLPNTEGQPVLRPFQKLTFASHLPYISSNPLAVQGCVRSVSPLLCMFFGDGGCRRLEHNAHHHSRVRTRSLSVSHVFFHSFAFQRKPSPPPRGKGTSRQRHARFATNRSAQPGRRNIRRGSRLEATDCRTLKTGLDIMVKRLFGPVYTPEGRRVSLTWNTGFHFSCDSSDEEPSVECMGGTVVLYCMMQKDVL